VLVPLTLVVCLALSACGGADDGTKPDGGPSAGVEVSGATAPTDSPTAPDLEVAACDLLSPDQVGNAVGTEVEKGIATTGPVITGGEFSSCSYASADADHPADAATVTLYPNTDAADTARGEDSAPIMGLGDQAFTSSFGSVWVYVDQISFFVQWYTFNGTDQENLPKSKALAMAVLDQLA
jgi:hypothetical protein